MTDILTRAQWAAKAPKRPLVRWRPGNPKGITLHHGGAFYEPSDDPGRIVRAVQGQYQSKDHTDIAYNMLVIPMPGDRAIIACGRGLEHEGSANGSAVVNDTHLSICVVGQYITAEQAAGIKSLKDKRINPVTHDTVVAVREAIEIAKAYNPSIAELRPHYSQNSTVCPGGQWVAIVRNTDWISVAGVTAVGW